MFSISRVFLYSFTVLVMILNILAIFNVPDTTDFCMFRITSFVLFHRNFCNPSSIVLDQPPSTSLIILYCWTMYPGYRSCNSHRNGPYFIDFSSSFFFHNSRSTAALPILSLSSASRDEWLEMMEPR